MFRGCFQERPPKKGAGSWSGQAPAQAATIKKGAASAERVLAKGSAMRAKRPSRRVRGSGFLERAGARPGRDHYSLGIFKSSTKPTTNNTAMDKTPMLALPVIWVKKLIRKVPSTAAYLPKMSKKP